MPRVPVCWVSATLSAPDIVGGNFAIHLLLRNHKSGINSIFCVGLSPRLAQLLMSPIADVAPGGWPGHAHWLSPPWDSRGGTRLVKLYRTLSHIKGIGTLKLYGNDLFLWIYYGFVVVWYWRGVGERRVACELILACVRRSFVPTIAQMLLSYWRQIKATHDIKRPIKTGTFDKLRRHISPGRGRCPVWQINYEKFNGAAKRYFMLIN